MSSRVSLFLFLSLFVLVCHAREILNGPTNLAVSPAAPMDCAAFAFNVFLLPIPVSLLGYLLSPLAHHDGSKHVAKYYSHYLYLVTSTLLYSLVNYILSSMFTYFPNGSYLPSFFTKGIDARFVYYLDFISSPLSWKIIMSGCFYNIILGLLPRAFHRVLFYTGVISGIFSPLGGYLIIKNRITLVKRLLEIIPEQTEEAVGAEQRKNIVDCMKCFFPSDKEFPPPTNDGANVFLREHAYLIDPLMDPLNLAIILFKCLSFLYFDYHLFVVDYQGERSLFDWSYHGPLGLWVKSLWCSLIGSSTSGPSKTLPSPKKRENLSKKNKVSPMAPKPTINRVGPKGPSKSPRPVRKQPGK